MSEFYKPFIHGKLPVTSYPLDVFLPPTPRGIIRSWLKRIRAPKFSLILDPLCADPYIPLEIAEAGYRVLVICNNPINRFLIELLSDSKSINDYQAALSELAFIKRGNERLDQHLSSIYQTKCVTCGKQIPVDAYIWKRGDLLPQNRYYECNYCGDRGEYPLSTEDIDDYKKYINTDRYRLQAIEQIRINSDWEISAAIDAISQFTPKQLYFIFTLLNKIESYKFKEDRKKLINGLILYMLQESSTIWSWPANKKNPKLISTPMIFRENNPWQSIEKAIQIYGKFNSQIDLYHWPELPPPNKSGICIYPGRINELINNEVCKQINYIVSVLPRPNQAFWTLSALWSGWLWGKNKIAPLKSALKKKRYDWNWFSSALENIFMNIQNLQLSTKNTFFLLPEYDSNFLSSTLISIIRSNFSVSGLSIRFENKLLEIEINNVGPKHLTLYPLEHFCREVIYDYLRQCNEPRPDIHVDTLCKLNIINNYSDNEFIKSSSNIYQIVNKIDNTIYQILNDKDFVTKLNNTSENQANLLILLNSNTNNYDDTISDKIEQEVYQQLLRQIEISVEDIDEWICNKFPGLFTPDISYLLNILRSYCQKSNDNNSKWILRNDDLSDNVNNDVIIIKNNLKDIFNSSRYKLLKDHSNNLCIKNDNWEYNFIIQNTSFISNLMLYKTKIANQNNILILPERRMDLFRYKLESNPQISAFFHNAWQKLTWEELGILVNLADICVDNFHRYLLANENERKNILQLDIFS